MTTKLFILAFIYIPAIASGQLTVQSGAGVFLARNSELAIQGDIMSNDNLEGDGVVIFNGDHQQKILFNNKQISRVVIENSSGVALNSDLGIGKELNLKTGHLQCGQYTVNLGKDAHVGGNENAYIQTGSGGKVTKFMGADISNYLLPVGAGNSYTPLLLKSTGSYFNASIEVSAISAPSPNKPQASKDYLGNHWTIVRKGITGELFATAFYGKVNGQEQGVNPYYWNGHNWINKNARIDLQNKRLIMEIPEGHGEIFAMKSENELTGNAMSLLPNPVRDVATLVIHSRHEEDAVLRINDSKGNAVLTQKTTLLKGVNQVRINVMQLPGGYYTITSLSETDQKSLQMIKN